MPEEGGRYGSAGPGAQETSPGLPGSQHSDDTLALAKQASLAGVGAERSQKHLLDSQTNFEPASYLIEEPLPRAAGEQVLNKDSERDQTPDKTDKATDDVCDTPMMTRSQLMLEEHQM